jgi:hypothetical protein
MFESRKLAGNIHGQILADNITEQRGSEGYSLLKLPTDKIPGESSSNIPRQNASLEYSSAKYWEGI